MQFLPSLGSGILERSNFLEENVVRFWPSHDFWFLREVHRVSICGSPTPAGGDCCSPIRRGSGIISPRTPDNRPAHNCLARTEIYATLPFRTGNTMRILTIASGLAILFTTLAFGHLLHHYLIHASSDDLHSPAFLASYGVAVVAGVLSFIGACLLIRRGR